MYLSTLLSKFTQDNSISPKHSKAFLAPSSRQVPRSSPNNVIRSHSHQYPTPGTKFCLSLLSIALITTMAKPTWRGGDYFILQIIPSLKEAKTQGRNWDSGTEAKTMEEYCLLACSPWLTYFAFYTTEDLLPKGSTTYSGARPSHINH